MEGCGDAQWLKELTVLYVPQFAGILILPSGLIWNLCAHGAYPDKQSHTDT